MKIPEFYNVIIYLLLSGLLVPNFDSFGYFFLLDVVEVSKFTYSMLTVLTYGCLLVGTVLYNAFFKESEFRSLFVWEVVIKLIFLTPLTFIFIMRVNVDFGIPDIAMMTFVTSAGTILTHCLLSLPGVIIGTKICPKHIEATMFAVIAGIASLRGAVSSWVGAWVNDYWVGVTDKDLSKYWILVAIKSICSLLPLFFIWLIPTRKQVEKLQIK